jgi:hypothetical protein
VPTRALAPGANTASARDGPGGSFRRLGLIECSPEEGRLGNIAKPAVVHGLEGLRHPFHRVLACGTVVPKLAAGALLQRHEAEDARPELVFVTAGAHKVDDGVVVDEFPVLPATTGQ